MERELEGRAGAEQRVVDGPRAAPVRRRAQRDLARERERELAGDAALPIRAAAEVRARLLAVARAVGHEDRPGPRALVRAIACDQARAAELAEVVAEVELAIVRVVIGARAKAVRAGPARRDADAERA